MITAIFNFLPIPDHLTKNYESKRALILANRIKKWREHFDLVLGPLERPLNSLMITFRKNSFHKQFSFIFWLSLKIMNMRAASFQGLRFEREKDNNKKQNGNIKITFCAQNTVSINRTYCQLHSNDDSTSFSQLSAGAHVLPFLCCCSSMESVKYRVFQIPSTLYTLHWNMASHVAQPSSRHFTKCVFVVFAHHSTYFIWCVECLSAP